MKYGAGNPAARKGQPRGAIPLAAASTKRTELRTGDNNLIVSNQGRGEGGMCVSFFNHPPLPRQRFYMTKEKVFITNPSSQRWVIIINFAKRNKKKTLTLNLHLKSLTLDSCVNHANFWQSLPCRESVENDFLALSCLLHGHR